MPEWVWMFLAGWIGFIAGFFVFALMRIASDRSSDEQIAEAGRDYYKT